MKNFGYTWQWGNSFKYTINICTHWNYWALPLAIDWNYFNDAVDNKCYNFSVDFLCFVFNIDIWKWKK